MTDVLSTFVKIMCPCQILVCCCARVLQFQPCKIAANCKLPILGCLAVDVGVNKEISFLANLRGEPFNDIKVWILWISL